MMFEKIKDLHVLEDKCKLLEEALEEKMNAETKLSIAVHGLDSSVGSADAFVAESDDTEILQQLVQNCQENCH